LHCSGGIFLGGDWDDWLSVIDLSTIQLNDGAFFPKLAIFCGGWTGMSSA
jgi:hypothetical protein